MGGGQRESRDSMGMRGEKDDLHCVRGLWYLYCEMRTKVYGITNKEREESSGKLCQDASECGQYG